MTKEVEEIVRNKAYIELTQSERDSVNEYAQNEEEYNNLQWFLTGTTAAFGASKIQASAGLKKGVMEHLTESKKKKGFWLNSVGLFMLPNDKKFYQKPAFQLGIAAVLVVGLLFVLNPGVNDNGLAVNTIQDTEVTPEEELLSPTFETSDDEVDETDLLLHEGLTEQEAVPGNEIIEENSDERVNLVEEIPAAPIEMADDELTTLVAPKIDEPVYDISSNAEVLDMEVADVMNDLSVEEDLAGAVSEVEEEESAEVVFSNGALDKRSANSTDGNKEASAKKFFQSKTNSTSRSDLKDEVSAPSVGSANGYQQGEEWIKPKSMHINKTKELNNLFYTVK